MAKVNIKQSSLLNLTDLEFEPGPLKQLTISDELVQTLSWLTAATKHDRKLLRCDENGALIVTNAWALLDSVENDELYPQSGTEDSYVASVLHSGILVSTSGQLVKIVFNGSVGVAALTVYVPANSYYWYPHKVYSVDAATVPDPLGTASYVGITAYI